MHKRKLFEAVRQRMDQKDMERNVPGSIEVSMGAFVPSQPYNDRRLVFTMMAIFMALGTALGTAYLFASKNQVIYTHKDIPLPMQIKYLGSLPSINLKRPIGKELGNEIKRKQFLLNESIRVIRTTLLSRLDEKHGVTILISSSAPGTGKSSG